jgi:CRP-like cAMP-binding protein
MSKLIESLRSVVPLTAEEQSQISAFFQKTTYKKGDHFLKTGNVCRKVGFVETGALYYNLTTDGQDNICDFAFEQYWCTHYKSLNSGEPSEMNIVALEDCTLHEIQAGQLEQLARDVPKVQQIRMKMAEKAFIEMSHRSIEITSKSAELRYKQLLETQPHILQRVPLSFVASYLGITQRHLSRLRATVQ